MAEEIKDLLNKYTIYIKPSPPKCTCVPMNYTEVVQKNIKSIKSYKEYIYFLNIKIKEYEKRIDNLLNEVENLDPEQHVYPTCYCFRQDE